MTEHYLDRLARTINENWDNPALTDFYLTEDGSAQDTSRGNHYTYGKIAIVPVGVQQVSSVQWTFQNLQSSIFNLQLTQGTELGKFLFGGSDVVLFFEPGRAPQITAKNVKLGDDLIENR